ncbi:hypothetical protein JTE90_001335 [Oedothorax gibbosus]|uniref:purine-nucleoside phosphorylase n=1 Tax=Oedothorax gibbosus TaxID=931172 RepID=A0AAV6V0U3_9ARAC|nr:hypothetical protein JTE90_001335 [Oedothorax gibbosus]
MCDETQTSRYSYERIVEIADFIKNRSTHRPTIGVICGSGLGGFANSIDKTDVIPYAEIPGFPVCTASGHIGKLILGKIGTVTVVAMQGRFHIFEGYSLWKCVLPVRIMKLLGVRVLLVTNAAGGLNPEFQVGDIMLIKDHINLPSFSGMNPLKGENDERWGPRFIGLNNPYDLKLRNLAREVGSELGFEDLLREGVYAINGGPSYETVAELRMLRILGVDAIGKF